MPRLHERFDEVEVEGPSQAPRGGGGGRRRILSPFTVTPFTYFLTSPQLFDKPRKSEKNGSFSSSLAPSFHDHIDLGRMVLTNALGDGSGPPRIVPLFPPCSERGETLGGVYGTYVDQDAEKNGSVGGGVNTISFLDTPCLTSR